MITSTTHICVVHVCVCASILYMHECARALISTFPRILNASFWGKGCISQDIVKQTDRVVKQIDRVVKQIDRGGGGGGGRVGGARHHTDVEHS